MKTIHLEKPGSIDGLVLREHDVPRPAASEVLIRVHANSLNFRDNTIVAGYWNPGIPKDLIPVSDGAGEVIEVGEGVTRVAAGDRVAGAFYQRWIGGELRKEYMASDLGGVHHGMLSEYVLLNEAGVVRIPPHLSYEEAATLPCAGVTAWNGLIGRQPLSAGETVLIQGSGGVSIFALQMAKLFGARVIATSSSEEKLDKLKALGADELIDYKRVDWLPEVLRLTDGRGVDLVVEMVGDIDKSIQALRIGGRLSFIGIVSGKIAPLTHFMIPRMNSIHGISVGSRDDFEAMNRAITLHRLRPVLDRKFQFPDIQNALQYLQKGAHVGKVIITYNS